MLQDGTLLAERVAFCMISRCVVDLVTGRCLLLGVLFFLGCSTCAAARTYSTTHKGYSLKCLCCFDLHTSVYMTFDGGVRAVPAGVLCRGDLLLHKFVLSCRQLCV